jgi:hypothetical protein
VLGLPEGVVFGEMDRLAGFFYVKALIQQLKFIAIFSLFRFLKN